MRLALSLFLKMSVTLQIIQGYLFSVLYRRKKKNAWQVTGCQATCLLLWRNRCFLGKREGGDAPRTAFGIPGSKSVTFVPGERPWQSPHQREREAGALLLHPHVVTRIIFYWYTSALTRVSPWLWLGEEETHTPVIGGLNVDLLEFLILHGKICVFWRPVVFTPVVLQRSCYRNLMEYWHRGCRRTAVILFFISLGFERLAWYWACKSLFLPDALVLRKSFFSDSTGNGWKQALRSRRGMDCDGGRGACVERTHIPPSGL